ncbi:hypothetical protein [Brachybacterium sp. GPGPB12]|uniref:hypothetical protein n=1 Tax=Brachybacterium sp. GPGPB12 TaxID=3023517 RepID=UPI0031345B0A
MVVPGLYGYVSATKWLTELKVTRFADDTAYWTTRGWSERGPIKIASRIDVPRSFAELAPDAEGAVTLGGTAWAQRARHRGGRGADRRRRLAGGRARRRRLRRHLDAVVTALGGRGARRPLGLGAGHRRRGRGADRGAGGSGPERCERLAHRAVHRGVMLRMPASP